MIGARIGAIIVSRKKGLKYTGRYPSEQENLEELAQLEHHEKIEDVDIYENTKQKITIRKFPFIEWTVAFAFFAAFAFSEYMIWVVNEENKRPRFTHNWTQLLLLSLLLLVSAACLYEGEVETVILDKAFDKLMVRYTSFLCKKRFFCHSLSDISGIRGCVRGHKGPSETEHYVICIFLNNSRECLKVLFSKSPDRIKKQMLLMRKFL